MRPLFGRIIWFVFIITIAYFAGTFYFRTVSGEPSSAQPRVVNPRGPLTTEENNTIDLFESSKQSVVFISTKQQVRDIWTRNIFSVPRGTGSGFVWDDGGHIITNYHVVEGASEAIVKLEDGRDYQAKLVGVSPAHDIAVLRVDIDAKTPLPISIGESSTLRVGQSVLAIGNPFGLDWTLTTGVVSALDRSLSGDDGQSIEHLIQTDAAINPGNSGGPLLDSAGRLIGMNTAIYSPSGVSAGIGFAVPIDTINRVVPQIIRYRKYSPPTIGVVTDQAINQKLTASMGIEGVAILRVQPGSSAQRAGLLEARIRKDGIIVPGDIIIAIDGKPVSSVGRFLALIDDYRAGQTVHLLILRHGNEIKIPVQVENQS